MGKINVPIKCPQALGEHSVLSIIHELRALFQKHQIPALRLPPCSLHSSLLSTLGISTDEVANHRGRKLRPQSTLVEMVTQAGGAYPKQGKWNQDGPRMSVYPPLLPTPMATPKSERTLRCM